MVIKNTSISTLINNLKHIFKDLWNVIALLNIIIISLLFIDYYIPIEKKTSLIFKDFIIKSNQMTSWKRNNTKNYNSFSIITSDNSEIHLPEYTDGIYLLQPNQKIDLSETYLFDRNLALKYKVNEAFYNDEISFLKPKLIKILYFLSSLFSILFLLFKRNNLLQVVFSMFTSIGIFITIIYFWLF